MMAKTCKGGCACGSVRYALSSAPMFVHCCHCTDCQNQTGTAFALNALIEADRVKSDGGTEDIPMPTDSGRPHVISRCQTCKTALWSIYGGSAAVRFVRVGSLDNPSALPPDVHIFTRSKLPWVNLKAPLVKGATTKRSAHVCKVYYDVGKLWPAASLARRKTALGG